MEMYLTDNKMTGSKDKNLKTTVRLVKALNQYIQDLEVLNIIKHKLSLEKYSYKDFNFRCSEYIRKVEKSKMKIENLCETISGNENIVAHKIELILIEIEFAHENIKRLDFYIKEYELKNF